MPAPHSPFDRRTFLGAAGAAAVGWSPVRPPPTRRIRGSTRPARQGRPFATRGPLPATPPRAEVGRAAHDHRRHREGATSSAPTERVIQAAVDTSPAWAAARCKVLPGTFRLRNAVYLRVEGPAPRQRRRHGPHQGAVGHVEAGGRLRLVRPGDHAGRRARLPGRRRRLPAGEEPAQRRHDGHQADARRPLRQPLQARQGACARTSGRRASRPPRRCSRSSAASTSPTSSIENLALDGNRANNDEPRRQLRRLHLPAGLQPRHHPPGDAPATTTATASAGRSATTCRRGLPQPRPRRPGPAPRLRLAAADHARQHARAATTSACSSAGA